MAETPKNTLKQWFVTGAKPQQAQYWAWLDSYWHKSEPISINAIDGLGEILVNKVDADQLALYAKKDASNINVRLWKQTLGVGELPANIGTIDYVLPSGEAMIGNAYKKVEQPNDGKTYLLKIDGTAVDGDTFGKNVSNSYLTSLPNTGLKLGAIWELDSNGFPLRFKNLPDKSTDSTFDDFLGKNNEGQLAKVGYQAFYNAFQGFSAQQSLTLSQLLAGGSGSDGAPNVNLISPPIIQNQYDSVEYVLLRGVNLKLNVNAMSIQILSNDKNTVLATIPNNQIQLSDDGITLVFFYNFHNFPTTECFIKIVSGAKIYITTLTLKIVAKIENINTSSITWEAVYDPDIPADPGNVLNGPNVFITRPNTYKEIPIIGLKSSQIFNQGDDFYIEMRVVLNGFDENNRLSTIGIGYSNLTNTLQNNTLINSGFFGSWDPRNAGHYKIFNNGYQAKTVSDINGEYTVIILKTGNLFRTIIDGTNDIRTLSNNSGYSVFASLCGKNRDQTNTVQCQIMKAFKFN